MNVIVADWKLAFTLGVPALVAAVGWIIGHWLNSRRELSNRRREARLKGLETAYMRIAMFAHRELDDTYKAEFEKFVAEIQLYGTPKQIKLMGEIVEAFVRRNPVVSLDAILEDLRNTLRAELRMEAATGPVWWYRFKMPGEAGAQQVLEGSTSPPSAGPRS